MHEAEQQQIEKLPEAHAFTADSFLKTAINADDELRQKNCRDDR